MALTDTRGAAIELEWLARVKRDELLALAEDEGAIDHRLSVIVNGDEVQRDRPGSLQ